MLRKYKHFHSYDVLYITFFSLKNFQLTKLAVIWNIS